MTNKKPKFPKCGEYIDGLMMKEGLHRIRGSKDWIMYDEDLELVEQALTLAENKGKLAVLEMLKNYKKEHKCSNQNCIGCEVREDTFRWLKSQLSEERVFSEVFSQKSSKEAEK